MIRILDTLLNKQGDFFPVPFPNMALISVFASRMPLLGFLLFLSFCLLRDKSNTLEHQDHVTTDIVREGAHSGEIKKHFIVAGIQTLGLCLHLQSREFQPLDHGTLPDNLEDQFATVLILFNSRLNIPFIKLNPSMPFYPFPRRFCFLFLPRHQRN